MANKSPDVVAGGVDEYIAACPEGARPKLMQIRTAIQEVVPDAVETTSYFKMPGYSYEGYDYNGMFAWFSYKKPYIRLHIRPPVIKDHNNVLSGYATTTAIVSFPEDKEIPTALVKKLVTASLKVMKDKT